MILQWTSSKIVVSRILRNTKGIGADYIDDILEWIPEAVLKMKTKYSLEARAYQVQIEHNQGMLPCKIEGLLCVLCNGYRLNYYDKGGNRPHHPNSAGLLFKSAVPIYTSSGDISAGDEGRSKFPTDVIVAMDTDCDPNNWYRVNGRYLETSVKCGTVTAWVQEVPKDIEGYPLIPDVENYLEAVYRYCRMMLIEAGYEDKIFNHAMAEAKWNDYAGKAIADTTFPTPDQVESSVHNHLDDFFPDSIF